MKITRYLLSLILTYSSFSHADLIITAVFDGPLPGGLPKGFELYAINDISDLSAYGVGSANNGGGSNGVEFTFPSDAISAGEYIYVATETESFNQYFSFPPHYTSSSASINGDDAIELFKNGELIDIFGESDIDGTGETWEYMDGWAYRKSDQQGSATFNPSEWIFSGRNALDNTTTNGTASLPVPVGTFGADTPDDTPDEPDPLAITLISSIQGNPDSYGINQFGDADVSPLIGTIVSVEAIVIGDFQDNDDDGTRNLGGFFIQEERMDEDGDPLSSEGIFVFDTNANAITDVKLGDKVRVTGTVGQYFGETQLTNISNITIIAENALADVQPANIDLAANAQVSRSQSGKAQADLEAYEGMLVTIQNTLYITEQFQLDRFNEVKLSTINRPRQFTQTQLPSTVLYPLHLDSVGAKSIILDDGLNQQNAPIGNLDGFQSYSEARAPRMGDYTSLVTGVLDYKWAGNSASGATWRIRTPVNGTTIFTSTYNNDSNNPRPLSPPTIAGNIKIASFNVLNLFHTLDENGNTTANGFSPRGADNAEEFSRQLTKIVNALVKLDADIVGLVELENEFDAVNDNSTAIEILINALNEKYPEPVYHYIFPGRTFVGSDAIAVGFIYKTETVTLSDNAQVAILDDHTAANLAMFSSRDFATNPIFNGPSTNRASLAASFTHIDSNEVFTIAVNHFKSKGPSGLNDTKSPNFDKNDGAGFWNQRRLDAANAVSAWLDTHPTGIHSNKTIIMGDLNAYAMENPVQYLLTQGYTNVEDEDAYSFVFDGQIGTLDYILISDELNAHMTEAKVWHINADEADALDYNTDFGRDTHYFNATTATRNSDHDPLVVGFNIEKNEPTPIYITTIFVDAFFSGLISGHGKNAFHKLISLLRFYNTLSQIDAAVKSQNNEKTCQLINKALRRSDGIITPRDWVTGEGVEIVRENLTAIESQQSCTHR